MSWTIELSIVHWLRSLSVEFCFKSRRVNRNKRREDLDCWSCKKVDTKDPTDRDRATSHKATSIPPKALLILNWRTWNNSRAQKRNKGNEREWKIPSKISSYFFSCVTQKSGQKDYNFRVVKTSSTLESESGLFSHRLNSIWSILVAKRMGWLLVVCGKQPQIKLSKRNKLPCRPCRSLFHNLTERVNNVSRLLISWPKI